MYEWIDPQFLRQRREDLIREVETHRPMKMLRIQRKERARLSRECAHHRRDIEEIFLLKKRRSEMGSPRGLRFPSSNSAVVPSTPLGQTRFPQR